VKADDPRHHPLGHAALACRTALRQRQRNLWAEGQPTARLSPWLIGANRRNPSSGSVVFCSASKAATGEPRS
jgi:hypothetical protein